MVYKIKRAFTIIELLVVIVVIGILASVIIVSYSNVSSRGTVASIQSDLVNAKKQILNFQIQNSSGNFPTSITTCPVTDASTQLCIKPSGTNNFSYNYNNTSIPQTFNLTASNGTTKYWINDNSNVMTTANIVTSGLVMQLDGGNPASLNSASNTWKDLTSNNMNGILYNGAYYSSSDYGSVVFDGVNDYVDLPSITDILGNSPQSLTSTFIIKYSGSSNMRVNVYYRSVGSTLLAFALNESIVGPISFLSRSYDDTLHYFINTPDAWNNFGKYIVIDATIDNLTRKFYVNGNLIATDNYGLQPVSNITIRSIIGTGPSNTLPFKGNISYASLYNRALSQSEITQNFNALRGRYGL